MRPVCDFFTWMCVVLAGWWLFRLTRRIVLKTVVFFLDVLVFLLKSLRPV
jgi:hypothetical protein